MVSVVIVSYNTVALTRECLKAVFRSDCEVEVILVDNGSQDGSIAMVKSEFPRVKIIENNDNVGFGRANNQAIKLATQEHVMFLNSDAYVFEDTISDLLTGLLSAPKCAVIGPKLMYEDGRLQYSIGNFPTLRRVWQMMIFVDGLPGIKNWIDSIHVRSVYKHSRNCSVDWVTGACFMVKKEAIEKTGGFDEKYFMYGEEMEWMYRIKKAGFEIVYCPESECIHLEGGSSPDRSSAVIGEAKGWIYWFNKYSSPLTVKLVGIGVVIGSIVRSIVKPKLAGAYVNLRREILRDVLEI